MGKSKSKSSIHSPHVTRTLDHAAVVPLAHQCGGDEAWRPMHLRDLVGEHVAVIIMSGHAYRVRG